MKKVFIELASLLGTGVIVAVPLAALGLLEHGVGVGVVAGAYLQPVLKAKIGAFINKRF